ncbi:OLC1v1001151C1, partial [Oldenlandia corymbosa var. corymbosa]
KNHHRAISLSSLFLRLKPPSSATSCFAHPRYLSSATITNNQPAPATPTSQPKRLGQPKGSTKSKADAEREFAADTPGIPRMRGSTRIRPRISQTSSSHSSD